MSECVSESSRVQIGTKGSARIPGDERCGERKRERERDPQEKVAGPCACAQAVV